MLTITYIYHDCFVTDFDQCAVVFDYWREADGDVSDRVLSLVEADKPIYVLVSHHHKDHFNRAVLKWGSRRDNIHFILSEDTARSVRHILNPESMYRGVRPEPGSVTVLSPGKCFDDGRVRVDAFGSTDMGNSYMVTSGGRHVFHAGDLNAWVWKDESTPQEVDEAIADYERILSTIADAGYGRMDVAMFPVDSRLGTDYWEGAYRFVRRFDVDVFLPMHFCLGSNAADEIEKMTAACRFREYANPERGMYVALQHPYSAMALPDKKSGE